MIGLILVTHGHLADQFVEAMEHVVGEQKAIVTVCIGPNDDMEQRRSEIAEAITKVDAGKGVIVLTDLFGGTPSNLAISLLEAGKVEVIREFIYPVAFEPAQLDGEKSPDHFPVTPVHPTKFETKNIGLVHDLRPRLLPNGAIEIEMSHRTTQFHEFLNFGAPITHRQERRFGKAVTVVLTENKMEMPVFSEQEFITTLRCASKQRVYNPVAMCNYV